MQKNIVELFGQLTIGSNVVIADIILDKHYEKFKYLYKALKKTENVNIENINYEITDDDSELFVYIDEIDEDDHNSMKDYLKNKKLEKVNFIYRDSVLLIQMNLDEGDVYEDRFNKR